MTKAAAAASAVAAAEAALPLLLVRSLAASSRVASLAGVTERRIFGRPLPADADANVVAGAGAGANASADVDEPGVSVAPARATGKAVFLGYDEFNEDGPDGAGARVTVEQLVLQAYALSGGWTGLHAEGWPLRCLFTLLLWEEAVFADVPDVFRTPYQRGPADLATEAFYSSRRDAIDARLTQVADMSAGELRAEVVARHVAHAGTAAVGVRWDDDTLDSDGMGTVAAAIGGRVLAAAFRRLADDWAFWSAGLPDLLLWRTVPSPGSGNGGRASVGRGGGETASGTSGVDASAGGNMSAGAMDASLGAVDVHTPPPPSTPVPPSPPPAVEALWVEVKSARDRLAPRQRDWLAALADAGAAAEVCWVVEKVAGRRRRPGSATSAAAFPEGEAEDGAEPDADDLLSGDVGGDYDGTRLSAVFDVG